MTAPLIAVAPYTLRPGPALADTPLAAFDFPLGTPPNRETGVLADLGPGDHVIFYPKSGFYRPGAFRGVRAAPPLMIAEPRAVHAWHMSLLRLFHRRFHRILTRDQTLLRQIPNGVFHSHTFASVEEIEGIDTTKARLVSLIASGKRDHEGHKMRHRLVEQIRAEGLPVDIMGRGYAPFDRKEEGLAPYRYSVVIENSREPAYISEKLLDACLCRTIPIYWGAPDVSDFVDPSGLILCETEEEVMSALRTLETRDSTPLTTALEENRDRALALSPWARRAAEALAASL